MSDEVKQAAERLRRWHKAVETGDRHAHEYACRDEGSALLARDESTLVDAYLADHANDAENALPLTDSVMVASGWEWGISGFTCPANSNYGVIDAGHVDGWDFDNMQGMVARVKTVGDLRLLLEALHVPAVVVVPKGGE